MKSQFFATARRLTVFSLAFTSAVALAANLLADEPAAQEKPAATAAAPATAPAPDGEGQKLDAFSKRVAENGKKLSSIMDDMYAYAERTESEPMRRVLEEMQNDNVLGDIQSLAGELPSEPSTSVGQLEYWADVTDRWAEDLLPFAGGCKCPGGGWKRSLPPEIVLEVMKIIEAEMGLREETRSAQNTKLAVEKEVYLTEANRLTDSQEAITERTAKVLQKLKDYEFAKDFGKQIAKIDSAVKVMEETTGILSRPNTGAEAIAAESEAIEILLEVKRGGEMKAGAESNPGSGGTGTTDNPALALLGEGIDAKAKPEDTGNQQSTGKAGKELPAEYRAGLDKFFELVEEGEAL
jgi:hypothetical protein